MKEKMEIMECVVMSEVSNVVHSITAKTEEQKEISKLFGLWSVVDVKIPAAPKGIFVLFWFVGQARIFGPTNVW